MENGSDGLNITEEKQHVKTGSILSMFGLLVVCFLVLVPSWLAFYNVEKGQSLRRAESIGYQVAQIHQKSGIREPSSLAADTGEMGSDPWGQPYKYKVSRDGTDLQVDIWTTGENGIKTQVRIPKNRL